MKERLILTGTLTAHPEAGAFQLRTEGLLAPGGPYRGPVRTSLPVRVAVDARGAAVVAGLALGDRLLVEGQLLAGEPLHPTALTALHIDLLLAAQRSA
jgi:hypothetical protein